MNVLSKSFLGLGAAICTGGLGFFGAYEGTKKDIAYGLKDRSMVTGDSSFPIYALEKLLKKLKDDSGSKKPKSDEFRILKNNLGDGEISKLKDFCEGTKSKTYSTILGTNENLLDDVKDFCTITIKEFYEEIIDLFDTSTDDSNKDIEKFKDKLSSLRDHEEEDIEKLEQLKNKIFSSENVVDEDWKNLAKWCETTSNLTFQDEGQFDFKQFLVYCGKDKGS